jgi:ribosomal protein L39E
MTRANCPTPENCCAPRVGACACQKLRRSPETIEKMRLAKLGKKHSPEAIEKMRLAKLGKKRSPIPAHLQKYAAKLRRFGIRGDELRKAIEAAT